MVRSLEDSLAHIHACTSRTKPSHSAANASSSRPDDEVAKRSTAASSASAETTVDGAADGKAV